MSGSIDTEPSAGNSSTNNRPEIPESWLELTLGEVIDYGKTVKAEPSEIPTDAWVLELEDIEKDTSQLLQRLTFAERQSKSTKNRFAAGDVLYGKLRPYLNKVLIANQDGYCTTEIIPLKPNLAINERYLFYWLKHSEFLSYVESVSHGIQMPRLGTEAGLKAPLILAPVNEQRRIVAKLDSLFARSRRAREELERIPKLCDRYKQAMLAAAFRGDLTAGWRQEKVNRYISSGLWSIPHQWQWHQMSEVCEHITKGTTPSKDKMSSVDAGIPFIKVYNLTFDGTLDFSIDPTFVDLETHEKFLKRSRVYPGDVLMNIVGPPLGKVSIVPEIYPEWNINQAIAIFRARPKILDRFISNYLLFEKTVNWCIQEAKATAGQFNLTLRICQDIPIPVPPIEEQKEIVRQIEKLFKAIDLMAHEYQKASKLCDRLDQATLSKAFRGELVSQDPNDEPAAVLLERLRAEPTQSKGKGVKSKQRSGGQL